MILDDDIAVALARVGRRSAGGRFPELKYEFRDIRPGEGLLDVEILQAGGLRARLVLDLPSSGRPQPWLYALPNDAEDWVTQLTTWIDEEVFTLGLSGSRLRRERDGESYVIVTPYGWQIVDEQRHIELLASAGPFGWHGNVYEI